MTEEVAKPKSARRRSREFAVQGIYQWLLAGDNVGNIEAFLRESNTSFARADEKLFRSILFGAIKDMKSLQDAIAPHVDRPMDEVSMVEAAVLCVAAYEIISMPETPYPVIINEAIELAKTFGGLDGHKFVNGVLDKLAAVVRSEEVSAGRAKRHG
ncbi:transcription antitermination factor NusB [Iodobacter sp. LRB]|uniref:Transcription antitermination protein NusB n=1 Tax=Iodobacter violaceini TaxID=3044271 RepID=A0ABX0KST8_9NEIS|nr:MULTISPECIES: transcription antitermination factor NusB [Iodobacter]NHQ85410.1 transcription antitermination factor NusB [Iodobacter violacea]PHV03722.1 transcription antitermination factor NusB [Iodobacter sp. BJB302]